MKTFKEILKDIEEVQSPRSQDEYDALSPKDKKIVDKRIEKAKKQGMSANPGESPRHKRKKRKPRNRNRRENTNQMKKFRNLIKEDITNAIIIQESSAFEFGIPPEHGGVRNALDNAKRLLSEYGLDGKIVAGGEIPILRVFGDPQKVLEWAGQIGPDTYAEDYSVEDLEKEHAVGLKREMGEAVASVELGKVLKKHKSSFAKFKKRGKSLGDPGMEDFYNALFDYFVSSGEMPYGTAKARTGDPLEWIEDRLMDEGIRENIIIDEAVDEATVSELVLYITNDGQLYRQRIQPIIKNLSKKVGNATYDGNKAIKLFGYAVTDGLKKYENEHATKGWAKSVDKKTREAIAEKLLDHYSEEIGEETKKNVGIKLSEDLGSHESLKGAIKFALKRGFVKEEYYDVKEAFTPKDPYTVKYYYDPEGRVMVAVLDGKKSAQKFLKSVKNLGMDGAITKSAS